MHIISHTHNICLLLTYYNIHTFFIIYRLIIFFIIFIMFLCMSPSKAEDRGPWTTVGSGCTPFGHSLGYYNDPWNQGVDPPDNRR